MNIKFLVDEDFVNYKHPSMFIGFPNCSLKCDCDSGLDVCQNCQLLKDPVIEVSYEAVCERYINNDITKAIVIGGMEPFDSPFDLIPFIDCLRNRYHCNDTVVIYTGYTENELNNEEHFYYQHAPEQEVIANEYSELKNYSNIIIKYGRFIPNREKHYDDVIGVTLASDNQYAKKLT